MFKVWDRVRVRTWLEVDKKYGIIECSQDHRDAHWMEWEVTEVFGDGVWYQVSFDPWLTFAEDMLELMESAPAEKKKEKKKEVVQSDVPTVEKRQIVSNRLRTYQQIIDKLEGVDRDMFFGMLYDKLESILFEEYWE